MMTVRMFLTSSLCACHHTRPSPHAQAVVVAVDVGPLVALAARAGLRVTAPQAPPEIAVRLAPVARAPSAAAALVAQEATPLLVDRRAARVRAAVAAPHRVQAARPGDQDQPGLPVQRGLEDRRGLLALPGLPVHKATRLLGTLTSRGSLSVRETVL